MKRDTSVPGQVLISHGSVRSVLPHCLIARLALIKQLVLNVHMTISSFGMTVNANAPADRDLLLTIEQVNARAPEDFISPIKDA